MRECLTQLGLHQKVDTQVDCIDIQRKPRIDLSKTAERDELLKATRAGAYDAILPSPPCFTFSRVPWANFRGPGQSAVCYAERIQYSHGSREKKIDFTWEVLELAAELDNVFMLLEQPEDLGAMRYGPRSGQRPSCVWQ